MVAPATRRSPACGDQGKPRGPTRVMAPSEGPNLKTLRLSLLICLGLTGPAVAQEGAAPVANDETSKLIDTMQTRVEQGNASVRDTAAAMAILSPWRCWTIWICRRRM